ncbi:MAG: 23S rRNA (uracil(1939)-C(5))-methyltransferase RlmD [Bacillota bacterium]|nr:23S rRNA (uracil(1939)-C(5))-methyltransferase RlmD [Bacillota bacterium]
MAKPIKKGEITNIEIIDLNFRGQGVGKIDNYVIFVNNTLPGDKVKIKISKAISKYAVGEVVEYIERSEKFENPECPYFYDCGGCQIMHMKYEEQLNYKRDILINELNRNNLENIENIKIKDTIGMEKPYRYRNKGAFPLNIRNGKLLIGPYEKASHNIVNIDDCLIQNQWTEEIIDVLRVIIIKNNISIYNERTHKGAIRHILMRNNQDGEIMLVIVSKDNIKNKLNKFTDQITKKIPNIKSFFLNINDEKTNRILGKKNILLYGDEYIKDNIFDLKFKVFPHTFFQVNHTQTDKLYNKALDYADINNTDIVYDLYCGVGTISLLAAQKAKEVHGIEIVKESIKSAEENKKENEVKNVNFHLGSVEDVFPKLYNKGIKADVVILDPPRKGCEESVLSTINEMNPKKIVYVSCNPSTLTRDLEILNSYGYNINEIQPVDMFPHSVHIETVSLLKN